MTSLNAGWDCSTRPFKGYNNYIMESKICAYSTADDAYALKAAVSLLSIREKADIDLFIVGRNFTKSKKSILASHGIGCIEIDLASNFDMAWDYPAECYYLFAGPKIFKDRGYQYSIYVDGDIYCNADPLAPLENELDMFAGVPNGKIVDILQADVGKITKKWQVVPGEGERIQTGVLYFNNKNVDAINFLEIISEIYKTSIAIDAPRKGDDSLFALFQMLHPELSYRYLNSNFNYIQQEQDCDDSILSEQVIFFHFTGLATKPWIDLSADNVGSLYFRDQWRALAERTFGSGVLNPIASRGLMSKMQMLFSKYS